MRTALVFASIAAAAVSLSSCGADDAPTAAPTTTSTVSTFADTGGQVPTDAGPKSAAASADAALTVSDIRLGSHPGFDRVVFVLGGAGTPGWQVAYTDSATQDGSGRAVDVAGSSILEVRVLGSTYPFDSTVPPFAGPDPVTDPGTPMITGVYQRLVYEGVTQSFVGIDAAQRPFAVSTLTDPPRLVVDIATP
ncbi:AMIN-like domain-containing (lipo)protein [Nocardia lasii]|uniref:AMIN-like domain-containing protein n=1 Tax=Nocardia lasii TaxID=1616107 RepID=A0ABW1JY26_9NOCA